MALDLQKKKIIKLRKPLSPEDLDAVHRFGPISLKLGMYAILTLYLYQAATIFYEYKPGEPWPFLLLIIRNGIFLFLHEGGHGLFMFFGRTLQLLGGSFWQIMFPLISFGIALRKRSTVVAPFALFWVGTNMLDVSLYMRDAPVRQLPLLGGHRSGHDWWNLFTRWNMLDAAGDVADLFYFLGLLISIGSLIAGVAFAFYAYYHPKPFRITGDDESLPPEQRLPVLNLDQPE
ncbi:MAG: hypothetical protein V1799_14705 [bacterium]